MRAIRAASAALLGVGVLALATPDAAAAYQGNITSFGFTVTPSTIAAGGRVTLALTDCDTTATVTSGVFDSVSVPSGRKAMATVDWDAKPGARYPVKFTCGGGSGSTNLTIAGGAPVPRPTPTPSVSATSSAPGGVRGGLGGSMGGMNTAEIVAGTALVMAAATGTIYVVRRRNESRSH
ncbi:lipoprotein [Streptomyces sp. 150FB]|uniref:hypothetical protein n=1 Tax=Streptomyces sp. 150FB TaxID=1576605 RepID=UPI0005890C42|nr:hypothetical protein [Streptomyces sp. 150FB]KIF77956.1 lipoprotein [Streptomyces sp. 150FB]